MNEISRVEFIEKEHGKINPINNCGKAWKITLKKFINV
jgi:hypothetical protein